MAKNNKITVPMTSLTVTLSLTLVRLSIILAILGVADVGGSEYDTVAVSPAETEAGCDTPVVSHGYLSVRNQTFAIGQQVEVTCEDGYRLPGTKLSDLHLICQLDHIWTDPLGNTQSPACERIGGCPAPSIANGAVLTKIGDYMPDDVAILACADGYSSHPPYVYLICQVDGTWTSGLGSARLPSCQLKGCPLPKNLKHGSSIISTLNATTTSIPHGASIYYQCNIGYQLEDGTSSLSKCHYGDWTGAEPKCVEHPPHGSCPDPPEIHSGYYYYPEADSTNRKNAQEGSRIQYTCTSDRYKLFGNGSRVCRDGHWSGTSPRCIYIARSCSAPPSVAHGDFNFFGRSHDDANQLLAEGSQVYYYCHSGYKMSVNISAMVCRDGVWHGLWPSCVKRTRCNAPMDIKNGNWVILRMFPDFRIGTKVRYECVDDFKPIGVTQLTCLASGYWSDYAPRCLPKGLYCSKPDTIRHGFYMCKPSLCDLYKLGTEIHYMCDSLYESRPNDLMVQRCERGGHWTSTKPICLPGASAASVPGGAMRIKTSTMTIVVATSCSVLGLLLIILVIVALQRHMKVPGRTCRMVTPPQLPPPPPYSEGCTNPTVDAHDRVALIAFADGAQIALPSYEEATRGRLARFGHASSSGNVSRGSSARSARSDYRLLPTSADPHHQQRDHHRNSIITTASNATRDNVSMAFGSIDTMNVSDGTSTTVTIGTFNSSSNQSLAVSQHAASGSLGSSDGSLANEDAPLLEQNSNSNDRNRHATTSPINDVLSVSEELKDV